MQYRIFGRTGVSVSEIGHGTWSMGNMWGAKDDKEAVRALRRSLELGVSFIDTAFVYGDGHSEKLIAKAFKEAKKKVFVATKVPPKNHQWPARAAVPVEKAFSEDHIVQFTETSLKNLNTDSLDLQQLHVWHDNWLNQADWPGIIDRLKKSGKVRFFGISINDNAPDTALKMVESGLIDSVQVIYNIFDQQPEEKLFPLCQKYNVGVIVRVPFDEGSLTGTLTKETHFTKGDWRRFYFTPERLPETIDRVEKLKFLIRDEIKNLAQASLKFCLSHPAVSTVIPGMRKVNHVEENCAVSDGKLLHPQELAEIKKHAWPRNFYPIY